MPALLTRRSTSVAAAAAAAICAALVTSSCSGATREPWQVDQRVHRRDVARGGVHPSSTPAATSASTMASPMPRLAPVTSAVLPAKCVTHVETPDGLATRETERGTRLRDAENRPFCLFTPLTIDRSAMYCQGVPQRAEQTRPTSPRNRRPGPPPRRRRSPVLPGGGGTGP